MKKLKTGLLSFFLGVVLFAVPYSVYAACASVIIMGDGTICPLVSSEGGLCTYDCTIVGCKHRDLECSE